MSIYEVRQLPAPAGSASEPSVAFLGDSNTGIYSPGADQVAISTNGTGRLFVDAAGLVGVGTSSPAAIFSSKPSASSTTAATTFTGDGLFIDCANTTDGLGNYGGAISWSRSGSSTTRTAAITNVQTASDSDVQGLAFLTHSSSTSTNPLIEAMRITGAGLVGIGDTGPDSTLTIKAAASTTPLRVSGPSSEFARIDSSGRLLVGTASAVPVNTPAATTVNPQFEIAGNAVDACAASINAFTAVAARPSRFLLTRSKSDTVGIHTVVANDDAVGEISFAGSDGTKFVSAAAIAVQVDGTPGANDMPGRLVFSTTADGAATPTEAMRINNQRELLIGTTTRTANGGVLQVSNGITFPGTQSACSDPNTLDDYEEGTWTPVVTGWTSIAYANQVGNYVKIGRQVTAWFYLGFTGTSSASAVTITGLPFTVATRHNGGAITYHDAPTDETSGINIFPAGTTITFYADNDTAAAIQSNANITTNKFLAGSVTYAV